MKYEYKAVILDSSQQGGVAGGNFDKTKYESYLNGTIEKFAAQGWEYVNYAAPGYNVPYGVMFIRRESK